MSSSDHTPDTNWLDQTAPPPRLAYSDMPPAADRDDSGVLDTPSGTAALTRHWADSGASSSLDPTVDPAHPAGGPHTFAGAAPARSPHGFSPGVRLGPFVGSAVMTAVIAGLTAWLGVFVVNGLTRTAVPHDYWVNHGVTPTMLSTAAAVTLAAASAILAAGAMWLLLMITAQAQTFFSSIAGLVGAIATVVTFAAHPWQESLGPAALIAVIACVIATLTPQYARLTTTSPERL